MGAKPTRAVSAQFLNKNSQTSDELRAKSKEFVALRSLLYAISTALSKWNNRENRTLILDFGRWILEAGYWKKAGSELTAICYSLLGGRSTWCDNGIRLLGFS